MVGLTNLATKAAFHRAPELNERRARFVLGKIDEILAWEQRVQHERDSRFVDLGRYLCEVRARQYWRLENLASFDDFLARRFPDGRRKAYYLMSIHENIPRPLRPELRAIGWTKAAELAKVARADGEAFKSASWLHKAQSLAREEFKQEVEQHLTGRAGEPYDLVTFKLYRTQLRVIEQAIETAAKLLGSDRSRGYCLEMICADFLAGANLDGGNPDILLSSTLRLFDFLSITQQRAFLETIASRDFPAAQATENPA